MTDGPAAAGDPDAMAKLAMLAASPDAPRAAAGLLADAGWVDDVLSPLFARLGDTGAGGWPFAARQAGGRSVLILHRAPAATLSVTLHHEPAPLPDRLVVGGRLSIARLLSGPGQLTRWHAGPVDAGFCAATAPALAPPRTERVAMGDVLTLDGRQEGQWFAPLDGPAALMTLTLSANAAPLAREYILPDGRLSRVTASEGPAARAVMLTAMLGAIPGNVARGFDAASRHACFAVRWPAMREWLAHDAGAALPRLTNMANHDPHPEIRAAARATLPLLASPCRA